MEIEDSYEDPQRDLELHARLLLADAELEHKFGITDENRRDSYELMLRDWENPLCIQSLTRDVIQKIYDHINESLELLDRFKEAGTPISEYDYVNCLDESYRDRWTDLQKILKEILES